MTDHGILEALQAWGLDGSQVFHVDSGLINRTYRLDHPRGRFILQCLNPIFDPRINHDIEAVTRHLAQAGRMTPRLVNTHAQTLWFTGSGGSVWRLLTLVEGQTLLMADSPGRCREAGRLLGDFHRVLWGFTQPLTYARIGVHDTHFHLDKLGRTLIQERDHRHLKAIEPVARDILKMGESLHLDRGLPDRVVHGDPKISNILFSDDGRAVCLIDLDTLSRMPIAVELGDAFRSWCNPSGEEREAEFDLAFFRAGLQGYAGGVGDLPTLEEREAIPALVEIICVELAARFCVDALLEEYFAWDPARYESASAHNLQRARSQLALGRSVHGKLDRMLREVRSIW